nr:dynein axonemal heavy chain 6-like [Procambarus clarkii]
MLEQEAALSVTVADFVEACRVTVNLLARRRTELRDSLGLFKGGMDKLHETSGNVEELKGELSELEPELKATQEEGQRLTHALSQQRSQVSHIRDQMITHEEKVKEKCEAVAALNEEIVQEVGEAVPGLEAAEKAIRALDKKDLVEVRVLNKPPDLVLAVMEPICLLLNVNAIMSTSRGLSSINYLAFRESLPCTTGKRQALELKTRETRSNQISATDTEPETHQKLRKAATGLNP